MKIISIALLFLALSWSGAEAETKSSIAGQPANPADLRPVLNTLGSLGEGHFRKVLEGLKVTAVTTEVQSGEWEEMKGVLSQFEASGIKAAALWFMRPDGSYYVAGMGLTNKNLNDRPYFPRLMAGNDVIGDLVISKATGKRTAIVAVPVKKNGRIIGALGTSLSLEEISRMLDAKAGLPRNMFFYALDQNGQTSLHRTPELLFGYPSDMGSESLAKTIDQMLAEPEGVVRYDFYGERIVVYKKFPLTGWTYAIGIPTGKPGKPVALSPVLIHLNKKIAAELQKMDQDLAALARKLADPGQEIGEKKKMLAGLCRSYPYAVDCALVDRRGRMVLVEPEEYRKFEGSDISGQEQVVRLQKTKKPVLSNAFKAVEGFYAVDLEHPVMSPDAKLAGSVSILIKPESLFAQLIRPVLQGIPVEAFIMQTDGRILYDEDEDEDEVGRMLFEDPMYKPFPQLLALGSLIAGKPTGAGSYEFRQKEAKKLVRKDAQWTTIGLHGTEWRLVVMHLRAGEAPSSERGTAQPPPR